MSTIFMGRPRSVNLPVCAFVSNHIIWQFVPCLQQSYRKQGSNKNATQSWHDFRLRSVSSLPSYFVTSNSSYCSWRTAFNWGFIGRHQVECGVTSSGVWQLSRTFNYRLWWLVSIVVERNKHRPAPDRYRTINFTCIDYSKVTLIAMISVSSCITVTVDCGQLLCNSHCRFCLQSTRLVIFGQPLCNYDCTIPLKSTQFWSCGQPLCNYEWIQPNYEVVASLSVTLTVQSPCRWTSHGTVASLYVSLTVESPYRQPIV